MSRNYNIYRLLYFSQTLETPSSLFRSVFPCSLGLGFFAVSLFQRFSLASTAGTASSQVRLLWLFHKCATEEGRRWEIRGKFQLDIGGRQSRHDRNCMHISSWDGRDTLHCGVMFMQRSTKYIYYLCVYVTCASSGCSK